MRACDGFVMVFDLTQRDTLEALLEFHEEICRVRYDEHGENASKYPLVLVGNKVDLESHHEVHKDQAIAFSQRHLAGCPYLESSAAKRINIDETFDIIVRELRRIVPKGEKLQQQGKKRSGSLFTSISNRNMEEEDLSALKKF